METSPGVFVAVVGPSGAGKDSLIRHARDVFINDERMLFVRRVITRNADLGSEDHDTMSLQVFEAIEASGAFAVTWRAHGLAYGIPLGAMDHVRGGGVAVANCSRSALPKISKCVGKLFIVNVTARAELLAVRVAARGREPVSEIMNRVSRQVDVFDHLAPMVNIENNGSLEQACENFVSVLRQAQDRPN